MNPFGERVTREKIGSPEYYPERGKDIDFQPERITQNWALGRIENRPTRRIRNAVGAFVLTVGLSAGIFSMADNFYDTSLQEHLDDVAAKEDIVENAQDAVLQADYEAQENYANVTADIGEACASFLGHYLPDQLEDVSETDVLGDALLTEGLPCGDTPYEIRADYRALVSAKESLRNNSHQSALAQDEASLTSLQAKTPGIRRDDQHNQSENGKNLGVAMGLLSASIAVGATRSVEGYRKAKLSNYLRHRMAGTYYHRSRYRKIEISDAMAERVVNKYVFSKDQKKLSSKS